MGGVAVLHIALPKGRYLQATMALLDTLAIRYHDKKLSYRNRTWQFEVHLLKAKDIPHLVYSEDIGIGLAPDEWVIEEHLKQEHHRKVLTHPVRVTSVR